MHVFSYLELHTTLIAWQLFGVVYDTLAETGLILLPLAWSLVRITARAMGEERGEGHETAVSNLKSVLQMVLVLIFCMVPVYTVDPSEIRFQPAPIAGQPQAEVNAGTDPTTYRDIPGGTSPSAVPAWWGLLHNISTGIANAVIRSLPDHVDLREAKMHLSARNIEDPALSADYKEFLSFCFHPAKRNYQRLRQEGRISRAPRGSGLDWPGSPYLISMPGGYAPCTDESHCRGAPHFLPPELAARVGAGMNPPRVPDGRGVLEVSCADWWETIRGQILEQAREDQGYWDEVAGAFHGYFARLSEREREDVLVRKILENFEVRELSVEHGRPDRKGGSFLGHVADEAADLFGALGGAITWATLEVMLSVMMQIMPILIAIFLMFLVMVTPFALLFTGYRIETVIRLSFLMFSAVFLHALLAVAGWLDHYLTVSLFEGVEWVDGGDRFFGHAQKRMIVNLVLMVNYIAAPVLWMKVMSAVGMKAGTGIGDMVGGSGSMTTGAGGAGEMAKGGQAQAVKLAKKSGEAAVKRWRN